MGYFIIIRGPAGVGKSTISKLLAKKIKAEVIHYDQILRDLGLDYILGEKWIPLYKFLKADEIMVPKFRKKLDKDENLILEGNFYHKGQIEDLTQKLNFPHFIFTLKANLSECIQRDKTRRGIGEQRIEDVSKLVSVFDYGNIIDTNGKSPGEITKEIMPHLPKFNE